jgi:hypothetical protein
MPHSMPGTVGRSDVPAIEAQTTRPRTRTVPQHSPIGRSGHSGHSGNRDDRIGAVHCARNHVRHSRPSRKQIAAVRSALGAMLGRPSNEPIAHPTSSDLAPKP